MTGSRVDVVRGAYEAFSAGDRDALLALCTPNVALDEAGVFPDATVKHGNEGWREWEGELEDRWADLEVVPTGFQEFGDLVIADGDARMKGVLSGAPVSQHFVMAFHFSGSLISRIEGFQSVDEAITTLVRTTPRQTSEPSRAPEQEA